MTRFHITAIKRQSDDYSQSKLHGKDVALSVQGYMGSIEVRDAASQFTPNIRGLFSQQAQNCFTSWQSIELYATDKNFEVEVYWNSYEKPVPLSEFFVRASKTIFEGHNSEDDRPLGTLYVRSYQCQDKYNSEAGALFLEGAQVPFFRRTAILSLPSTDWQPGGDITRLSPKEVLGIGDKCRAPEKSASISISEVRAPATLYDDIPSVAQRME